MLKYYLLNYYGKRALGGSIRRRSSALREVAESSNNGRRQSRASKGDLGQDSEPFGVIDVFVTSSFNSLLWHRRSEEAGELVKLLLEVDFRFARQLRLDDLSSYLSTSHRARFFRNLARAFPSLLDTLCSTDEKLKEQIAGLQRSICFMCDCCAQS